MATPLAELLRAVLTDDTVRQAAGRSPSALLHDHGWEHLDAADLREAMLVLADGAPSAEAVIWVGSGESIDPDAGLADALAAAAAAIAPASPSDVMADDPADLDGDAAEHDDGGHERAEHDDDRDDDPAPDVPEDSVDDAATGHDEGNGALDLDAPLVPDDDAPSIDVELDEPERFAHPEEAPPDDDAPAPGEFGDGWDDLI